MEEQPLTCEGCGRELEPEARYCMWCGRPVPRSSETQWGDEDTAILQRAFGQRERPAPPAAPARGRRGQLIVRRADGLELFTVEVPQDRPLTIGRDSNQDVRLLDLTVSRAHAVIEYVDGHYTLRDVGSTNATLLNGEPITQREVLFDGAEITIGTHILIFREE